MNNGDARAMANILFSENKIQPKMCIGICMGVTLHAQASFDHKNNTIDLESLMQQCITIKNSIEYHLLNFKLFTVLCIEMRREFKHLLHFKAQ